MKKDNRKALIFALLSVLCWSTIGSATKITLGYATSGQMLFWANASALLFLLIFSWIKSGADIFRQNNLKEIGRSALMGFINPFLFYLLLFEAYGLLPAQEAGTLNYIWPIILVLMSALFLKEKLSLLRLLAISLSFLGLIVISTQGSFSFEGMSSIKGIVFILLGAILWSLYWILNIKDLRKNENKLMLNFMFGFIYILIYQLSKHQALMPESKGFLGSIYIGIFEMGLTFYLWLTALTYSKNTARTGNLIYLSPFISLIFIALIVGETITPASIVGLAIIVGGILWQQSIRIQKSDESKEC